METKIQMTTVVVARVNGIDILASQVELGLVPVKPICESFGIDSKAQRDKLNSNPLYTSVGVLSTSTGADGKNYEMYCLPFEYCLAWMLGINSSNIKEEIREKLLEYQILTVGILKKYFFGNMKKQLESNAMEISLLEEINNINEQKNQISSTLREKKILLQKIREERLNNEPTLFD